MQLQYVFGNPRKTKKKVKQGGNAVGKLKGAAKAKFLARMNAGRKRAGLKAVSKKRKGKRGRNPARYHIKGELPVTRKVNKKTPKFYTDEELRLIESVNKNYESALEKDIESFINEEPGRRQGKMLLGMADIKGLKRDAAKVGSLKKTVEKLRKQKLAAEKEAEKYKKLGGEVELMKISDNPRKKGKGKRKGKRKSSIKRGSFKVAKRKGRKGRRKGKRKNPKGLSKTISFKLPKKRKFKRARVTIKMNPDVKHLLAVYGTAAVGGAAYPWFNYGVNWVVAKIDSMIGGKAGEVISKLDNAAPGVAAPTISLAAALGVKELDRRLGVLRNLGDASKYVHSALDTIAVLSAAGIGMALANKAKLSPAAMGLSGVKYFPGAMGGADFGTYPQLGSSADFGGVKYFPQPMGGVEFFQDGARGDEMYTSSEKDDLAEAHGLGIIPEGLGVIPEGLGNADFGVIPEGLGGDEGQMG